MQAFTEHDEKVRRIANELKNRTSNAPLSLRKKAPPHQVPKHGDLRRKDDKVDLTDLDQILLIDPQQRICIAEPGVTYVDLVEATLEHDLVPIVVPELKTITIGGAVSGCSIESMSYKHGGFHDTCLEYEVITSDGNVMVCTPDNEHQLVFQMIHGAFGTLGILSRLKFKLVPAKKFVKMTYEKYATLEAYLQAIDGHYKAKDIDFMDGIIHSATEYVLSAGMFVDKAPYTNSYDWMKIYYKSTSTRKEDYLRTPDYFFRYDRGVTNVRPNSFLGRLFFGKWANSTTLLALAHKFEWLIPKGAPTMTLDTFLPFSRVTPFLEWWQKEMSYYPLWCVPYKRVRDYEWIVDGYFNTNDELFVDLAIYGMKVPEERNAHRLVEEKLHELRGIKTLIAHNYYSRREFWEIFNKRNFDTVKAITDPKNRFRDLYDKTCMAIMGRVEEIADRREQNPPEPLASVERAKQDQIEQV